MKILLSAAAVVGALAIGGVPAVAPTVTTHQAGFGHATPGHGVVLVDDTMHSCGWKTGS